MTFVLIILQDILKSNDLVLSGTYESLHQTQHDMKTGVPFSNFSLVCWTAECFHFSYTMKMFTTGESSK